MSPTKSLMCKSRARLKDYVLEFAVTDCLGVDYQDSQAEGVAALKTYLEPKRRELYFFPQVPSQNGG